MPIDFVIYLRNSGIAQDQRMRNIMEHYSALHIAEPTITSLQTFANIVEFFVGAEVRLTLHNTHLDYLLAAPMHPSVYYVKDIIYDNPLINDETLMSQANLFGGNELVRLLLDLGQEMEYGYQIIEAIREQGYKSVFRILLGYNDHADPTITSADVLLLEADPREKLEGSNSPSYTSFGSSDSDKAYHQQPILLESSVTVTSENTQVAATGACVMKIIEVKESIGYLFTEMIPIFDKSQTQDKESFIEKEGLWIAIHFAGGVAFSWGLPGAKTIGTASKVIAPISATSSYTLRHYYHEEFKEHFPGYTLALDTGFAVVTGLPVAYMTGNYGILLENAAQGAAISALSHLPPAEVSWAGWFTGNLAALAVACKKASDVMPADHNFGSSIVTINKIASMLTAVTLVHKLTSQLTDQIIDALGSIAFDNNDEL